LYSFDSSTVVHFFDNYPMDNPHLKLLWDWFEGKMNSGEFVVSKRAYEEIRNKTSDDFFEWFKDINIIYDRVEDLLVVQMIKDLLEIEEDNYHSKGVDENDLFIIVISKRINTVLISEEGRQPSLPRVKSKYKIPSVCNLPQVNVECINFTELLNINP